MKHLVALIIILQSSFLKAQSLANEVVLEDLQQSELESNQNRKQIDSSKRLPSNEKTIEKISKSKVSYLSSKPTEQRPAKNSGNLPIYAIRTAPVEEYDTQTAIPKNTDFNSHIEVRPGDTLRAVISQNIVAYPGSKAPVTGRILEGKFKGALVLGEATMDETTKRVNIHFKSIRPMKSRDSYALAGVLLSEDGMQGLQGEYESNYWTYFWAETITNTVAGFADATTKKTQTIWGTSVAESGIDPATRQGIAQGLAKTADRLGDRAKNAPEMTTVHGPTIVQITVTQ